MLWKKAVLDKCAHCEGCPPLSALVAADKLRMPHIDGIFALADVAAAFKVSEGGQAKGKLSISVFNATAVAPAVETTRVS